MSDSNALWDLEGFPKVVECPNLGAAGEVQRAYEAWVETRRVNPLREATELDPDSDRFTAVVRGACYLDERDRLQQLKCDFQVNPGLWGRPGVVVYVDSGFVPFSVWLE